MEKRIYEITIRVNERERDSIRELARRDERKVAEWLRALVARAARENPA